MIISGFWFGHCTYFGMVVGERLQNDYRQSRTFCTNQDRTKDPLRSFYSYNSSMLLVLYWYKSYSTINLSILFHKQNVILSICYFYYKCALLGIIGKDNFIPS